MATDIRNGLDEILRKHGLTFDDFKDECYAEINEGDRRILHVWRIENFAEKLDDGSRMGDSFKFITGLQKYLVCQEGFEKVSTTYGGAGEWEKTI